MNELNTYRGDDDKCSGCGCDPCIGSSCSSRSFRFGRLAGLGLVTAISLSAVVGCAPYRSPCLDLPAPTAQELAVASSGGQVEREIEGEWRDVECDLINGQWVEERSNS